MKEFNAIITDQDLSELLKGLLISNEQDTSFTERIMDMECKKAFTNVPLFITPSLQKEKELLKNLNRQFGHFSNSGWLLTGIGTAAIVTSAVFIGKNNVSTGSISAGIDTQQKNEAVNRPEPNTDPVPQTSHTVIEKKPDVAYLKDNGFKYFSSPSVVVSPDLNLYDNLVPDYNKDSYSSGTNDTIPNHNNNSAGILRNLSKAKNKLVVDTFFKGINRLEVSGPFANLNVAAIPGDDVSLKGDLSYEMKGLYVKQPDYKIHYERSGPVLKIWIENEKKGSSFIMGTLNYEGALNLNVPENTEIILKNKSGNINLKGTSGNTCNIEADFGHIKAEDIRNNIRVKSLSGDIAIANATGDVDVQANFGHIDLKDIKGTLKTECISGNITAKNIDGNSEITAKFGHIKINLMHGDLKANSTSGNISLTDIKGDKLNAHAAFGHISIVNAQAETIILTSQSGDITTNNISGKMTITSHFGNQILTDINGDIKTRSSSGSITIKKSSGNMNIYSGYGNVRMDECTGKTSVDVRSGDVYGKNFVCSDSLNIKAGFGNIHITIKNNIDELSFDLNSTSGIMKINKENTVLTKETGNLTLTKGKIIIKTFTTSGDQLFD